MSTPPDSVLIGHVVEEQLTLTVDELSGICAVERQRIVELVDEGVLEAQTPSLQRARLALRLQRDLGVNVAGTALVIELLERIDQLERRLQRPG